MHDTAIMVHHTTQEARTRSEMASIEQERDHFRTLATDLERERDEWRDQAEMEKKTASRAAKQLREEHEKTFRVLTERHEGMTRGTVEREEHEMVVERFEEKLRRSEKEYKEKMVEMKRSREKEKSKHEKDRVVWISREEEIDEMNKMKYKNKLKKQLELKN